MSSWKCLYGGVLELVISAFRISLGMMIPNTNEEWKYNICVKRPSREIYTEYVAVR